MNNFLMACVKPCIPIFISPIYIHMWKKKGFLALENVKLCSGDTVNPITVQHSVKVSFCVIVLFVKVIYIFYFAFNLSDKEFYGYFDHFVQFYFDILYFIS